MSKEKGIPETPRYQIKETLIQNEIIEKVRQASVIGSKETIVHNTVPHVFTLVEMNIDDLYYNLENDRTLTKTREFIEDHLGYPDDYFNHSNTTSLDAQKHYHDIIFDFIPSKMPIILDKYRNQRDSIYITQNGTIANGNTRVACFRELLNKESKETFRKIKCLVIPEELDDWKWIRGLVDQTDNIPDFSSRYPWYARAERMEREFVEYYGKKNPLLVERDGGASDIEWREISKIKEYPNPSKAKQHFRMLILARDFISQGFEGFKRLSDLDKIGNESALQAFDTFEKGHSRADEGLAKDHLKYESFAHIASKEAGHFGNTHRVLQQVWSNTNIDIANEKIMATGVEVPNIFAGETSQDHRGIEDIFILNRYKEKSKLEETIDDSVGVLFSQKQVSVDIKKKEKFRSSLDQALNILKHGFEHNLKDSTDLSGVDSKLETLQDLITQMKNKVDGINGN